MQRHPNWLCYYEFFPQSVCTFSQSQNHSMMHKGKEIHVSAGMSGSVLLTGPFATKVNEGKIMMRE